MSFSVQKTFDLYNDVHLNKRKSLSNSYAKLITDKINLLLEYRDGMLKAKYQLRKILKERNKYIRAKVDHKTNIIYFDNKLIKEIAEKINVPKGKITNMMKYHEICHIFIKKHKLMKGISIFKKHIMGEVISDIVSKEITSSDISLLEIDKIYGGM